MKDWPEEERVLMPEQPPITNIFLQKFDKFRNEVKNVLKNVGEYTTEIVNINSEIDKVNQTDEKYLQGIDNITKVYPDAFDVLKSLPWTINSSDEAKGYVPRINVTFYQQTKGQLLEAGYRWWELAQNNNLTALGLNVAFGARSGTLWDVNQIASGGVDDKTYDNMYIAKEITQMTFPFFSKEFASLQHSFENNNISEMASGYLNGIGGNILNVFKGLPTGFGIEQQKAYGGTTPTSTSFSFILYNTINTDYIQQNEKLINYLIFLNSAQRYGIGFILPPVLVSYEIPGIKYSPVAQMSLNITSLGQVTYKDGKNIPDAYQIDISFSDLVQRTRNFHLPTGPRNKVKVFKEGI